MALKKSQLYSKLWQSCDQLRGGMDASQYKDYVLTLLFMKYVTDKHKSDRDALIEVPEGGGFDAMVELVGHKDIGDGINKIISKLAEANKLKDVIDQADFNDESKLGTGKEMQDRLSKLVSIFKDLDFSANRASGDDLLGDAYEYLMRHFATESGKSKGQFYTPAEVSRIMAQVVGINSYTRQDQTIYDPTCGSGSLLLKAADEAPRGISVYGQEMDIATYSLARMNLILHGHEAHEVWRGNTLAAPYFKNSDGLKTFDFAVANPPFSAKAWSTGLDPGHDEFSRFEYGVPPAKNGDYAFLQHLITSLKSRGKGAIILPHGVLFRGNREADIRRHLIRRGLIRGIIGLPANLFYGTGIPACIIVIDKEDAAIRKGIFMIDASRGFIKDGNKNRLREQDIHRVVDAFTRGTEIPRYSRMVPLDEIASPANDYNLNIPRYIDSSEPEDLHDLEAHLHGGIPNRDIDALADYWSVFPQLRHSLFRECERKGYSTLQAPSGKLRDIVGRHPNFEKFARQVESVLGEWREEHEILLKNLGPGDLPNDLIDLLSEVLLDSFKDLPLMDEYDVYQQLMDYWAGTMQDDVYLITQDGWGAGRAVREAGEKEQAEITIKKGRKTLKYVGELIPAELLISRFFSDQKLELDRLKLEFAEATERKTAFEEEYGGDEGILNGLEGKNGVTKGNVQDRVMEIKTELLNYVVKGSPAYEQARRIKKTSFGTSGWQSGITDDEGYFAELDVLRDWVKMANEEAERKNAVSDASKHLNEHVLEKYAALDDDEIKQLVVEDKWFSSLRRAVNDVLHDTSGRLANRLRELDERYARPLPDLQRDLKTFETKVEGHLRKMGISA